MSPKRQPELPELNTVQLFLVVGANRRIRFTARCVVDAIRVLKQQEPESSLYRADGVLLATLPKLSRSIRQTIERLVYEKPVDRRPELLDIDIDDV